MQVQRTIDLPVPPAEAWAVLMDWERQADWMRDADRIDVLTDHREGVGVRIAVRTRVFDVPAFTEVLEVLTWAPPSRLVIAHRSFVGGTGEWRLDPFGGGARFTWSEDLSLPVPLLGELALRVYRPFMRMLMGTAMADLRAFLIAIGPRRTA
jgi:uncharacterized protein YndB with AHSA1/START domain